jgi:hypothetical protein
MSLQSSLVRKSRMGALQAKSASGKIKTILVTGPITKKEIQKIFSIL